MNKGCVIKHNANQRYATTAVTTTIFKKIAERTGFPIQVGGLILSKFVFDRSSFQEIVVRNDMPCGSTIGPILSTRYGIATIGKTFSIYSICKSMKPSKS